MRAPTEKKLAVGNMVVRVDAPTRLGTVVDIFASYVVVVCWPEGLSYEFLHDLRRLAKT